MTLDLPFAPGDLLLTHPGPDYWGCAVVLSAFAPASGRLARFHVGTTPIIRRREFDLTEIELGSLTILRVSPVFRVAPRTYATGRLRTCIGVYAAASRAGVRVLGRVDPKPLYLPPLTLEVGDGTAGAFPLCGTLRSEIGHDAMIEWRRVHDAEAFEKDCAAARERYEVLLAKRPTGRKRGTRRGPSDG